MVNNLKPVGNNIIKKDNESFVALKNILNYATVNKDVELTKVEVVHNNMVAVQEQVTVMENQLKALNDKCAIAEHAFHDAMLEVKSQVKAQFGANSDELNSLGLKKKADYIQRKTRKKKS